MELSRNAKILRFVFKSVEVEEKSKKGAERISFSVNGIRFTTIEMFASERAFLEDFLHCEKIKCRHVFEETMIDCEEVKEYLVWTTEDGDVTVSACS